MGSCCVTQTVWVLASRRKSLFAVWDGWCVEIWKNYEIFRATFGRTTSLLKRDSLMERSFDEEVMMQSMSWNL